MLARERVVCGFADLAEQPGELKEPARPGGQRPDKVGVCGRVEEQGAVGVAVVERRDKDLPGEREGRTAVQHEPVAERPVAGVQRQVPGADDAIRAARLGLGGVREELVQLGERDTAGIIRERRRVGVKGVHDGARARVDRDGHVRGAKVLEQTPQEPRLGLADGAFPGELVVAGRVQASRQGCRPKVPVQVDAAVARGPPAHVAAQHGIPAPRVQQRHEQKIEPSEHGIASREYPQHEVEAELGGDELAGVHAAHHENAGLAIRGGVTGVLGARNPDGLENMRMGEFKGVFVERGDIRVLADHGLEVEGYILGRVVEARR